MLHYYRVGEEEKRQQEDERGGLAKIHRRTAVLQVTTCPTNLRPYPNFLGVTNDASCSHHATDTRADG